MKLVAGRRCDQDFYSAEFLSVLAEPAHAQERRRSAPPVRRHLSDDALHAPTLLAGGLACLLAAGTATAFWIAIGVGVAPPSGKAGLPIIDAAQMTQPFADEGLQVRERTGLPTGLALLSAHGDALPAVSALEGLLDVSLLHAPTPRHFEVMGAAQPTAYLVIPAVKTQTWPEEHEPDLLPVVTGSSSIRPARAPESAASPDARPAPLRFRFNEGGKDPWSGFRSASIRTASFTGPAESSKRAGDIAAKSPETQPDRHRGDTIGSDAPSKNKGGITGKRGSVDSNRESIGANSGSERSNGSGKSGRGNGDGDSSDRGGKDKGKSDKGNESTGHKGSDDGGKGHGDQGKGDKGKGDRGKGDKGRGGKGSRK